VLVRYLGKHSFDCTKCVRVKSAIDVVEGREVPRILLRLTSATQYVGTQDRECPALNDSNMKHSINYKVYWKNWYIFKH